MKRKSFNYTFLISLLIFFSCSTPWTKEAYLEKYEKFIKEVSTEYKEYDEDDWINKDEKFAKFNGEWYDKFKDEYTWKEEIILTKYSFQYNVYRARKDVEDLFNALFGSKEEVEKKIKYYVENDMQSDLEFLIQQAEEISESAEEFVNETIKKYQNN